MEEILRYLKTNIDENCSIAKWKAKEYLNIQLAGSYDYYLVNAFSEDFLLIKPVDEMTIQKTKVFDRMTIAASKGGSYFDFVLTESGLGIQYREVN